MFTKKHRCTIKITFDHNLMHLRPDNTLELTDPIKDLQKYLDRWGKKHGLVAKMDGFSSMPISDLRSR